MSDPSLDLVRRAQEGVVEAVGELYYQHREYIFRYVRSRIYETRLAEDLTGEVFMRMVEKLSSYQDRGIPFRVWLYTIARNLVLEHFRKVNREKGLPLSQVENLPADIKEPSKVVEDHLNLEQVLQEIEKLEHNQGEVVRLRFLVGMSLQEVSLALNKTVAAVKALQHRGLATLREELKQE